MQNSDYYVWIGANGDPVSKAWPYEGTEAMAAEYENKPKNAYRLSVGQKDSLQMIYGLSDEDFTEDDE